MEPGPRAQWVGTFLGGNGIESSGKRGLEQAAEILDALPVLVFLERAGKIVFANAEARQMLGLTEGEWVARPVEDVLWGLFPGTAEPQTLLTGTQQGQSVPRHHAGQRRQAAAGGRHL